MDSEPTILNKTIAFLSDPLVGFLGLVVTSVALL